MREFFKVTDQNLRFFLECENNTWGDPTNPAHVGRTMRLDEGELDCFVQYLETWDLENSQPVDDIFDCYIHGGAVFKIYDKKEIEDSEIDESEILFETETHIVLEA